MCNVYGFVPHCEVHLFAVSATLPIRQCLLRASCLFIQIIEMSYSWSRYWKTVWAATSRRPLSRHGRRLQTPQRALCMTCRCLTNVIAISPTRKSSTRVARGIPLVHTTPKRAQTASGPCQRMQPLHGRAYPLLHNHPGRRTQSRYGAELVGFPSSRARTT